MARVPPRRHLTAPAVLALMSRLRARAAATRGFSQYVAKALGVDRGTVSSWIMGRYQPDGEHALRLLNLLMPTAQVTLPDTLRVLVIDDHASQRARISEFLESPKVHVVEADGEKNAIAALAAPPHVITLDIVFDDEDSDGYRLSNKLRQELPHVPIIAVSSRTRPIDKGAMIAQGATDYIPKSELSRERLVEAILKHLPAAKAHFS